MLWLAADRERFSEQTLTAIQRQSQSIFVSAISAFEIAIKQRKKKLELPCSPGNWFREFMDFYSVVEIPVSSEIALKAVSLPGIHNDPCDRIIIATALMSKMTVVTADSIFNKYKNVKTII
jgi:PIN domain nuclease of toxin-antitoxin system